MKCLHFKKYDNYFFIFSIVIWAEGWSTEQPTYATCIPTQFFFHCVVFHDHTNYNSVCVLDAASLYHKRDVKAHCVRIGYYLI
jgi:hypothetical protein